MTNAVTNKIFTLTLPKTAITIFFSILLYSTVYSQVELNLQGGYLLLSNIPTNKGDIIMKDNPDYGLGLKINIDKELSAEVSWSMQNSSGDLRTFKGERIFLSDATIHHFLAGAVYETMYGKIRPIGLVSAGVTLLHPTNNKFENAVRFTIALGVGGKFYLSDRFGLRLQARLILPMQFTEGGFWCGTGGCGTYVGSWTQFIQGDFSGGIFVRLGK